VDFDEWTKRTQGLREALGKINLPECELSYENEAINLDFKGDLSEDQLEAVARVVKTRTLGKLGSGEIFVIGTERDIDMADRVNSQKER
jgi:hypothetical protein